MLILLPPSEGKADVSGSDKFSLKTLSYAAELSDRRLEIISRSAPELLLESGAAAIKVYSGVLFKALNYPSLTSAAKRRAESEILIFSAPFGVLRPSDKIPPYKLKIKSSDWSGLLPTVLDPIESELIVDCRSSTYQGAWRANPSITVAIRVFQVRNGARSVITHMSKKYRGELTRHLLLHKAPKSPEELLAQAQKIFTAELHEGKGQEPWFLDLLIPSTNG